MISNAFHRQSKKPRAGSRVGFFCVVALLVVAAASIVYQYQLFSRIPTPIVRWWRWVTIQTTDRMNRGARETLFSDYASLLLKYQKLLDERTLMQGGRERGWNFVIARSIGRVPLSLAPLLLLDRGEQDGVRVGLPVVAEADLMIGRIVSTTKTTSILEPLTHPKSRIAASVMNTERTIGIVQGDANISVQLQFIPRTETIAAGEVVITSGLQEHIPRGLVIGRIEQLINDPGSLFQRARLDSFGSAEHYGTVSVLLDPPIP